MKKQLDFVVFGAAGYIARKHLQAIKDLGHNVAAICDPSDAVGVIDSYFPNALYFRNQEELAIYLSRRKRDGEGVDFVTVCSPNFRHKEHILMGLHNGCDVLCEKPLVLNPVDAQGIFDASIVSNRRVSTVLQLRLHKGLQKIREEVQAEPNKAREVQLRYYTPRGKWYDGSWKSDIYKSGGLITNIGIHLFDMLLWIFGEFTGFLAPESDTRNAQGVLYFGNTRVEWRLSLDRGPTREITIDGVVHDFSAGFTDLHTEVYRETLEGRGFGIFDVLPAIRLAKVLRESRG